MNSELLSHIRFGRAAEAVEPRGDPNIGKADLGKQCNHLCLRQSACDSTGPEVYVTADTLVQRIFHCNIG